jgi:16S rRNA (guanine1516-N2)-methyltransferase
LDALNIFVYEKGQASEKTASAWFEFLKAQSFDFTTIQKIDFTEEHPKIYDQSGNKFCINFLEDKLNYHKKKSSMKKELLGRAMGSGRYGLKILDLSAGLGIDAIFLCQLGFEVTAVERNPLIFLALEQAATRLSEEMKIKFLFGTSQDFLQKNSDLFDVIYFDPMFPEKTKSALPRQEMVFFRHLVGADLDADEVVQQAVKRKGISRMVVKRPMKAPTLYKKPESQIEGKLVRFDIYGVEK